MAYVRGGFDKVSIFDPATGDTVQLNRIATEGSEFTKAPIPSETTQGQCHGGQDSEIIIAFVESDGLSQLQTWMLEETDVEVAVAGAMEFVLWQEAVNIEFIRGVGPNARDGVQVHQIGLRYAGKKEPDIYHNVNLIEAGSGAFNTFNSGGTFRYEFTYPIESVSLALSADYSNYSIDSRIRIVVFDYNGGLIFAEVVSITNNGNFEVVGTIPSESYLVRLEFDADESFTGTDITNRTIRIGTKSAYVSH